MISANNLITQDKFNLETFLLMKHCLVTISGLGTGLVDDILAKQGLKRNVMLKIPHFLVTSHIIAQSDLVVTLPYRMGVLLSQQKKIRLLEPPIDIPQFSIFLYWHIKNQNNPLHKWMRNLIKEISNKMV